MYQQKRPEPKIVKPRAEENPRLTVQELLDILIRFYLYQRGLDCRGTYSSPIQSTCRLRWGVSPRQHLHVHHEQLLAQIHQNKRLDLHDHIRHPSFTDLQCHPFLRRLHLLLTSLSLANLLPLIVLHLSLLPHRRHRHHLRLHLLRHPPSALRNQVADTY